MRKQLLGLVAACAALSGCLGPFGGEEAVRVASPDGRNVLVLRAAPLSYEVLRDGQVLVARTAIGLKVDGADLAAGGAAWKKVVTRATAADRAAAPAAVYKKGTVDLTRNEKFADFGDWGVALVARNDGVAYRFETAKGGKIRVDGETAGVTVPEAAARAWVNFTNAAGWEESVPEAMAVKDVKTDGTEKTPDGKKHELAYLPFVYAVGGKTVAVTESDVVNYPNLYLKRGAADETGAGVTLDAAFARWPVKTVHMSNGPKWKKFEVPTGGRWIVVREEADWLVETAGTRTFPWRTFILADAPSKLCEADIVWALARPADPAHDFSWVKPGKVAWDWWNAWNLQGMPFRAGCNTKSYEYYIDFAARTGVEYVIFDEGWSEKLNIWKFHPDVDVPHLIDYANKRGVGIILWMAWAQIAGEEDRVAEHFAKLGAKGFKVDFMDRSDAECQDFLWTFAEACRRNKMLVDYHGANRPTGMSRAYPNVLNYEGIHGLECAKWFSNQYDFMANDVQAFFLRLTAGPMDYTPGAMDNYPVGAYTGTGSNPGSVGTRCRQMAMMTLYEAPLQMLCDSPTKYEKNRECFTFMAAVPTVWEDTVGLGGCPDTFAAAARKAKDGAWYAAAMTNADARDWTLDTSFLGGGTWTAEIFRDAPDADTAPTHYVHETKTVAAGDKLPFHMAPGGGFTVRFTK